MHHGYIAQDLITSGFQDLTSLVYDPTMKACKERNVDNPENFCFVVPYDEIVPIVALNIKNIYQENEELRTKVDDLESRLSLLESLLQELLEKK